MPTFEYKTRDKSGNVVSGTTEAESPDALAANLRKLGYIVISINPKLSFVPKTKFLERFKRVKSSDIAVFTRQLSTLIEVGIPLLSALESINEQTSSGLLKDAINQLGADVKAGVALADAMAKHPKCFGPAYVSMVRAAEASGTISQTLERLAILLDYEEQTRGKIKAATRYPMAVTTALGIAFLILTTLVLPRYAAIYSRFDIELPRVTKILLGINYTITHYWYLVILAAIILVFSFSYFIKTKKGQALWDRSKLRLPIFGPLVLKIYLSRFMRISGFMLKTGVPILKVLDQVASVTGNVNLSQCISRIKENVKVGKDMASSMKQEKIFPPIVVQMISLGEESGKLDDLLIRTADFFDSQVDLMIQSLTSMIEPVLILMLGLGVLVMALSIFLPMWNLVYIIKR
jgi:type II secretory pathway component PulF